MGVKWFVCVMAVLVCVALTFIGSFALFFVIRRAITGIVCICTSCRVSALVVAFIATIVVFGSMVWAVKE